MPFENSTNGPVLFTLNGFADHHGRYPDLSVCAEIYVDVHHYLLGFKPFPSNAPDTEDASGGTSTPTPSHPHPAAARSKPLSPLGKIERVYSHPQVWGQCEAFLATHLKGVEQVDVSSTSKAAALVAGEGPGAGSAAISSRTAARASGLDVLAEQIEDREDNTTRFFVLRKGAGVVGLPGKLGEPRVRKGEGGTPPTKSMLRFTVPHAAPGALADVLECFRVKGLNLTSISSRPSLAKPFTYVFFVEFEGHRDPGLDPGGRVGEVLRLVGEKAETMRWLGSWVVRR